MIGQISKACLRVYPFRPIMRSLDKNVVLGFRNLLLRTVSSRVAEVQVALELTDTF